MKGSWGMLLAVLVVFSFVPQAPFVPGGPSAAIPRPPGLVANASFVNWTWTGDPCTPGTVFTAHFRGNATGGVLPYQFSWSFGDGSPPSTLQDPSHVFLRGFEWNVTLNVTDAAATKASATVFVPGIPIFYCPTEPVPAPIFLGLVLVGLVVVLAAAVAVGVFVWQRRARRRKGNSP